MSELQEARGPGGTAREEFCAATHRGVESDRFVDDRAVRVEEGIHSRIVRDGPRESEDRFTVFAGERGDARGAFAFERLSVDPALASDDEIAGGNAFFEVQRLGQQVEAGADFRLA